MPNTEHGRRMIAVDAHRRRLRSYASANTKSGFEWRPAYSDNDGEVFTCDDGRRLHPGQTPFRARKQSRPQARRSQKADLKGRLWNVSSMLPADEEASSEPQ